MSDTDLVAIVDSIEESTARLEIRGQAVEVPATWLPKGAAEGDVLRARLRADPEATRAARERAEEATDELYRDDDGGDLEL